MNKKMNIHLSRFVKYMTNFPTLYIRPFELSFQLNNK